MPSASAYYKVHQPATASMAVLFCSKFHPRSAHKLLAIKFLILQLIAIIDKIIEHKKLIEINYEVDRRRA